MKKDAHVFKIVLAGAPTSGKSSSVRAIRAAAEDMGLNCLVYDEAASELMRAGYDKAVLGDHEFQRLVLEKELKNELDADTLLEERGGIAVFDRASPDAWVYLDKADADRLAGEYGFTKKELLSRFDLCLFFKPNPVNDGSDIQKGNPYRVETDHGEIRELDDRSYAVWHEHPACVDLEWENDPEEKPRKAAEAVRRRLRDPGDR